MPDLTGSYVGGNYRKALDNFSRFGTRKLAFYTIEIGGLSQSTIDYMLNNEVPTDPEWPSEWTEPRLSVLEAVQRGVQLVAEPYMYGAYEWDNDGSYYYLYLTAVVAGDTVADQQEQESVTPVNTNSYTFESAIADALDNFEYDYITVLQADLSGTSLNQRYGANALQRNTPESVARNATNRAARIAAGKTGFQKPR